MATNRKPIANARLIRIARHAAWLAIVAYICGFCYFLKSASATPDSTTHTDVIVVPTGGSGRISVAVALLQAGLADRMFISGVNPETEAGELARLNGQSAALFTCCVVIGHKAANTVGNAAESAGWMRANGYRSLRLVTSGYHLPRALLAFHSALPDVEIVPHPVIARATPELRLRYVVEYNKYLVALARFELSRLPGMSEG